MVMSAAIKILTSSNDDCPITESVVSEEMISRGGEVKITREALEEYIRKNF